MEDFFCPTCGEFRTPSAALRHRCPPIWFARRFDHGDDGDLVKVYGWSAQEAAADFCKKHDEKGDYDIMHEGTAEILVYDKDMKSPLVFDVEARSEPVYDAMLRRHQPEFGTVIETPAAEIPDGDS